MATKVFVGKQVARPKVMTLTVGTAATDGAVTLTAGGTKAIAVTPTTTNTSTTASEIQAALAASTEGEFAELTFTVSGAVVTVTGPDDGAPFTFSKADGGSNSTTLATPTAPLSPHDVDDAANWDTASVPGDGDTAVFDRPGVDGRYNLDAFAANTVTVVRRSSHTGTLGLPAVNPAGYREYRPTHFATAGTAATVEQGDQDGAEAVKLDFTGAGSAVTVTVTGPGTAATPGDEAVHLTGLPASSVVNAAGAGVAVAPDQGQAAAVATLRATDATLRCGAGVTLGTAALVNTTSLLRCGYTTLGMDRGGTVTVTGSGGGATTNVDGGTLDWRSTGHFGALRVGPDGAATLALAPAAISPTSVELVGNGWAYNDQAGRAAAVAIDFTRCGPQDGTLVLGTHLKLTLGAHS